MPIPAPKERKCYRSLEGRKTWLPFGLGNNASWISHNARGCPQERRMTQPRNNLKLSVVMPVYKGGARAQGKSQVTNAVFHNFQATNRWFSHHWVAKYFFDMFLNPAVERRFKISASVR